MRRLDRWILEGRLRWRRTLSRLPRRDPRFIRPTRLVLRVEPTDVPVDFDQVVVSAVDWLGPLPVTVSIERTNGLEVLPALRTAHRLGCRTALAIGAVTDLDVDELVPRSVHAGLAAVQVQVGGISDEVHAATVGGSLHAARSLLHAFVALRSESARLDVEVGLPWREPAHTEARATLRWSREAGADGFRILPRWTHDAVPFELDLFLALCGEERPFHRTDPAVARVPARPCRMDGLFLEVSSDGMLSACQRLRAFGPFEDDLGGAWIRSARGHLEAIQACPRACADALLPRADTDSEVRKVTP